MIKGHLVSFPLDFMSQEDLRPYFSESEYYTSPQVFHQLLFHGKITPLLPQLYIVQRSTFRCFTYFVKQGKERNYQPTDRWKGYKYSLVTGTFLLFLGKRTLCSVHSVRHKEYRSVDSLYGTFFPLFQARITPVELTLC